MSAEGLVPPNDPLMIAWTAYQKTDEFQNTLKWAAHPEHVLGSLWAAFAAAWNRRAAPEPAAPPKQVTFADKGQPASEDAAIDAAMKRALLSSLKFVGAAPTVVEPEPVGKRMTVEELARTDGRFPFVWWREVPPGSLLYLAAPPRTPLTDAEIRKIAVEQASSSFGPADNDDETIDWIFNREDLLIFARAVIAASEGERK